MQASGRFDQPIVTTIEAAKTFYPAEAEHQDYYQRNPENYQETPSEEINLFMKFGKSKNGQSTLIKTRRISIKTERFYYVQYSKMIIKGLDNYDY